MNETPDTSLGPTDCAVSVRIVMQGPPREIGELVRYAAELTTPWQKEQKPAAKTGK